MKKILMAVAAVALFIGCTKEHTTPTDGTVTIKFSPCEVSPMKTTSSVSTVCSRLDIYIIEQGTTDTLRFHQERTATACAPHLQHLQSDALIGLLISPPFLIASVPIQL